MKSSKIKMNIDDLQAGFRKRQFTPLDIAKFALEKAKQHPEVFIQICEAEALLQAQQSTQRWLDNAPISELDGIPFGVKDLFDIEGYITTRGSKLYTDPANSTAPQVSDLIKFGAVLIGKTNLSEFAYSGLGLNPHFGTPTQKVENRNFITGGSSCGSAAAVMEGIVSFALGTDTAGSIRIPSSYCGLVGFRASSSRYDNSDIAPLSPSLDTTGPICAALKDVCYIDNLLNKNTTSIPQNTQYKLVFDEQFCNQLAMDEATKDAFFASIAALKKHGIKVENHKITTLNQTLELVDRIGWLGSIEAYVTYQHLIKQQRLSLIDPLVAQRLKNSNRIEAEDVSRLYQQRETLKRQLAKELKSSTLLMPTTLTTAPLLSDITQSVESFNEHNLKALRITMIGSYLDCPGIALPNGLNPNGLPTSLLLSQCSGNDTELLRHAMTIEPFITSLFNQARGNNNG